MNFTHHQASVPVAGEPVSAGCVGAYYTFPVSAAVTTPVPSTGSGALLFRDLPAVV